MKLGYCKHYRSIICGNRVKWPLSLFIIVLSSLGFLKKHEEADRYLRSFLTDLVAALTFPHKVKEMSDEGRLWVATCPDALPFTDGSYKIGFTFLYSPYITNFHVLGKNKRTVK